MARFPAGQAVSKQEICQTQEITPGFLIKIMQPLIDKGLVKSYRGVTGGFSLGRSPEEISLWDTIAAVQGPILLNKCTIREGCCSRDKTCPVHPVWVKAKKDLKGTLSQTTYAELLQQMQVIGMD
jgi:Rrf2 family protein